MSETTTTVKASELDRLDDQTDWDRLQSLSDEAIHKAVEADPDQEMLDAAWFE